jgi:hypothetical protein
MVTKTENIKWSMFKRMVPMRVSQYQQKSVALRGAVSCGLRLAKGFRNNGMVL